ncbi:hypothetical protein BGX30_015054 [Mortierella sp. GBA39]|nr:hypothetical protein BGX30_015054 [Mortierella sp. GBA39]
MPGDDRNRPEFPHSAGVAQDHPVQEAPFDIRQRHPGHEQRCQDDARHGIDDFDIVVAQPGAEPAVRPEHEHEDQPSDDGRHRKGQVDQRDQRPFAAKLEFSNSPGRGDAEHRVQRNGHQRNDERQFQGGQRIWIGESRDVHIPSLLERLGEDDEQRQHDQPEHRQPGRRD